MLIASQNQFCSTQPLLSEGRIPPKSVAQFVGRSLDVTDFSYRSGRKPPTKKIRVMNEKNVPRRGRGGRPPKDDPAAHRLTVNLTDVQYAEFQTMYEQSGVASLSGFIAARIFDREFRVIQTDAGTVDFVMKLSALYGQIRSVGVNYNQVVKQLHAAFGEKKALSLLYKLEQQTIELSKIGREVLLLCEEFKGKVLPE